MSSMLSSTRSRFSAGAIKRSVDASLISTDQNGSADQKDDWLSVKGALLDRRVLLAISLLFTFCIGAAAASAWQSSRQIAPVPQAAPAPVALSPVLKEQLEAMSSGIAAVRQSVVELSGDLGQMRRDITNLQTTQQALVDKISEPPPRPAAAQPPKPTPRSSQAPTSAR